MARPAYRKSRGSGRDRDRDEDDEDDRRGRGRGAARKPSGPPPMAMLAGLGFVILAVGIGIIASRPDKAPPPPPPPLVVAPPKVELEPPKAGPPPKAPPKPLTEDERKRIETLFQRAQPHIDAFRQKAKEGWALKGKEDNEGANEAWIDAKHEYQKAMEIVNEAMEDEDRFPAERPGMASFIGKLGGWTKELAALPKVNTTR